MANENNQLFVRKETLEQQMVNGLGKPVMTRAMAIAAGLKTYWTGRPCGKGHSSVRRVQGSSCMACTTIQTEKFKKDRNLRNKLVREEKKLQKAETNIGYKDRQKVLEVYAQTQDMTKAAKAIRLTLPELNVQIAKLEDFRTSVYNLEERFKRVAENQSYKPAEDLWDEEKRTLFVTAYIDTGDIASARDAVKVSASVYHNELERNPDFALAIKEARPKAELALEEKAIQLALKGNDKLLTLILKAKLPEYKEKIQIDQNVQIKLPEAQLNQKLEFLLNKYRPSIDAEFTEVAGSIPDVQEGQGRVTKDSGTDRPAKNIQ